MVRCASSSLRIADNVTRLFVSASYIASSCLVSAFAAFAAFVVSSVIRPIDESKLTTFSVIHSKAFATPPSRFVIPSSIRENITSNGANAAFRFAAISLLRFISFSTVDTRTRITDTTANIGLAFNVALNTFKTLTPPEREVAIAAVAPDSPFVLLIASCMLSA